MKNEEFYKNKIIELFSKDPKTICEFKRNEILKIDKNRSCNITCKK